jgi:transcription-repair coupling factor (superfamily II helicase)
VSIKFRQNATIDPERLARFVAGNRGSQFTPDGLLKFSLKAVSASDVLQQLQGLLEELAASQQQPSPVSS